MKYMSLIFHYLIASCFAQVAYDPASIVGWNATPHYDSFILAPYDIIFDAKDGYILPPRLRSPRFSIPTAPHSVNLEGFKALNISGSGQFSEGQLAFLVHYLVKNHHIQARKIVMVDLREEPHGFINQDAVTFFYGPLTLKKNQPPTVILADDQQRIRFARACDYVLVNHITKQDGMPATKKPDIIAMKSAATEQDVATKLGIQYIRIPVTDHFRPDHNDVDEFIDLVNRLDDDAWIHVKCRGGRGRTTTFMAMYDMLKNPQLSKDDFFKRQVLIHGVNFLKMSVAKGHEWKSALAARRLQFLNCFYEYLHAPDGYATYMQNSKENHRWSDWVRIHYPELLDETYESTIE
jgi:hypothetical protein